MRAVGTAGETCPWGTGTGCARLPPWNHWVASTVACWRGLDCCDQGTGPCHALVAAVNPGRGGWWSLGCRDSLMPFAPYPVPTVVGTRGGWDVNHPSLWCMGMVAWAWLCGTVHPGPPWPPLLSPHKLLVSPSPAACSWGLHPKTSPGLRLHLGVSPACPTIPVCHVGMAGTQPTPGCPGTGCSRHSTWSCLLPAGVPEPGPAPFHALLDRSCLERSCWVFMC